MNLNSILEKIDENSLPTSRTTVKFLQQGKCEVYCDMLSEKFYHWLLEAEFVEHASCRAGFEGVAHEALFIFDSLDGSPLEITGVK